MTDSDAVAGQAAHRRRQIIGAILLGLALLYISDSGSILRPILHGGIFDQIPILRPILITLGDFSVISAVIFWASGQNPIKQLAHCGLEKPIHAPIIWAVLWFTPALALCLIASNIASDVDFQSHLWLTFLGPISEEIIFRGLAVGFLMRFCGWTLIQACIFPAIFFAAGHLWQGDSLEEIAGLAAITGLGGLLFGWLFVRWGYNLWPPLLLHIGLNGLWNLFDLGENAVGGLLGNLMRIAVVAAAIFIAIKMTRPIINQT